MRVTDSLCQNSQYRSNIIYINSTALLNSRAKEVAAMMEVKICTNIPKKSCDSSVGISLGYGPDDRGSRVRFPEGVGNFSLHHRVQNGVGAHAPSYPMGARGSFPGGKASGA
jgi:hypothetical protein